MLSFAAFIPNKGMEDPSIHFSWDEWKNPLRDNPGIQALQPLLKTLSKRANAALTTATGEWIVRRFAPFHSIVEPLQCLEAAWAQQIDFRYSWDWELDASWTGPVKGPIRVALDKVSFAAQELRDDGDPSWSAVTISGLAEYVLNNADAYTDWRNRVLARLEQLYPAIDDERPGEVVPREALDPDLPFDPSQSELLVNEYLRTADVVSNPYLNTPEAMLELGFEGTPYFFDSLQDRRNRIEW